MRGGVCLLCSTVKREEEKISIHGYTLWMACEGLCDEKHVATRQKRGNVFRPLEKKKRALKRALTKTHVTHGDFEMPPHSQHLDAVTCLALFFLLSSPLANAMNCLQVHLFPCCGRRNSRNESREKHLRCLVNRISVARGDTFDRPMTNESTTVTHSISTLRYCVSLRLPQAQIFLFPVRVMNKKDGHQPPLLPRLKESLVSLTTRDSVTHCASVCVREIERAREREKVTF